MPLRLSAEFLAGQEGGYEPQRENNGQLLVFGVGGWDTPYSTVTLSLEAFDLPEFDAGSIDLKWQGQRRKVVGDINFSDLEITVRDFIDKATSAMVASWIQQVFNMSMVGFFGDLISALNNPLMFLGGVLGFSRTPPEGGRGLARDYKKLGLALLFGPDGSHTRAYLLRGLWPKKWTPGRIDYEGDSILKGTLTLSVDSAEYMATNMVGEVLERPAQFVSGIL